MNKAVTKLLSKSGTGFYNVYKNIDYIAYNAGMIICIKVSKIVKYKRYYFQCL